MRIKPVVAATLLALAGLGGAADAASLGEARALSSLGAPLRAQIALEGPGAIDASCFSVSPASGGLPAPALNEIRIAVRRGGSGRVVELSGRRPVNDPILAFAIVNTCDQAAPREYSLFFDPPAARTEPAMPAATGSSAAADGATSNEWQMVAGESLDSLAEALYPGNPAMHRRFISAVRKANPALSDVATGVSLPSGLRLQVPQLRATPAAAAGGDQSVRRRETPPPTTNTTVRAARSPAPNSSRSTTARLQIESAPEEVIRELKAREREKGTNVVDTVAGPPGSDVDNMRVKILELERIEAQLRAQMAELDARIEATRAQIAARQAPAPLALATAHPVPARGPQWETMLVGGLIAIVGLGSGGALALLWRRRRSGHLDGSFKATIPLADVVAGGPAPAGASADAEFDDLHERGPNGKGAKGIEVADLNFVLGLGSEGDSSDRSATQVLARYLEAKGLRTTVPWLALLDGFRAANLRQEYESLATRVRSNYNVQVPPWDEPEEDGQHALAGRAALEDYPHLVRRITASWGSEICLDYLDSLLQDNRNGTRKGFPIQVLGEILMLISVMEARREAEVVPTPAAAVVTPIRRAG